MNADPQPLIRDSLVQKVTDTWDSVSGQYPTLLLKVVLLNNHGTYAQFLMRRCGEVDNMALEMHSNNML